MNDKLTSRTYSLLGPRSAPPSEYEIVSSRLHYYVGRGFEVSLPLGPWYERYQRGSPLQCPDWEAFADPEQTTYCTYTSTRKDAEIDLDRVTAALDAAGAERQLPAAWTATLARTVPPLRYAFHGLHMIASYVGQMGPSGRITLCALFQSADELRRIERIAYRMRYMQETHSREFGAQSKGEWQTAPAWQPLREAVERLLVAYDWGEAFVGLNLCLKPALDEAVVCCLAEECQRQHDAYWTALLERAYADCVWQRRWSVALVRTALAQNPDNRQVIARWLELWAPRALAAAESVAGLFAEPAAVGRRLRSFHAAYLTNALALTGDPEP
jgi:hypothetical protein